MAASLLLILSCLQEDPAALVERLRSESVVDREEAVRSLKAIGRPAARALEAVASDPDPEVAARARRLLRFFELRETLPPRLLLLAPDAADRLSAGNDSVGTEIFLKLTGPHGLVGRGDVDVLAARALRGAMTPLEQKTMFTKIRWLKLRGAGPELVRRVAEGTPDEALEAVGLLKELRARDQVPAIVPLLGHKSREVRSHALDLLASLGAREQIPAIVDCLRKGEGELQLVAAEALVRLEASEVLPEFVAAIDDPRLRVPALYLVSSLGRSDVIPKVRPFLHHAESDCRVLAARAMGRLRVEDAGPDLLALLEDRDEAVVEAAAQALGELRKKGNYAALWAAFRRRASEAAGRALPGLDDPRAGEDLAPLLGDADGDVRWRIEDILETLRPGEPRPALMAVVDHKDLNVRRTARDCARKLRVRGASETLVRLLSSDDNETRGWALEMLGEVGRSDDVPAVRSRLSDPAEEVRAAAAEAIAKLGGRQAADDLRSMVRNETSDYARNVAIRALADLGVVEAVPDLLAMLRKGDEPWMAAAVEALADLRAPQAPVELGALLKHPSASLRSAAALGLADLRSKEWSDAIAPLLGDPDADVRHCALSAMVVMPVDAARPALRAGLRTGDPVQRWKGAEALGKLGDREAVPALIALLKGHDEQVGLAAAEALGKIGGDEARGSILQLLEGRDAEARAGAVRALGAFADAKASRPAVIRALADPDDAVRECAVRSLERLGAAEGVDSLLPLAEDPAPSVRAAALSALAVADSRKAIPLLLKRLEAPVAHGRLDAATALCRLGRREGAPWVLREAHSLFVLNALRRPETWARLTSTRYDGHESRGHALELIGRVATLAGLKIEIPADPPPPLAGPTWQWFRKPPTLVEVLETTWLHEHVHDIILEDDRIRVVYRGEAARFWEAWWEEERKRK